MDRVMDTIAVVMTTCMKEGKVGDLRASYAEQAIASLKNLRYDGPMRLHFADDGSTRIGTKMDLNRWGQQARDWTGVTFTESGGQGFGASLNRALGYLGFSYLVFYVPDDWVLTGELDLTIPARLLGDPMIGMVRTGTIHPDLYARTMYRGPDLGYHWLIDKEKSGYALSFRTFLAHRRFFHAYGSLPEGRDIYNTERIYNENVRGLDGPAIVYAGNVGLNWPWRHIGEMGCNGERV